MRKKNRPLNGRAGVQPRATEKRSFVPSPGILLMLLCVVGLAVFGIVTSRKTEEPAVASVSGRRAARTMPSPEYAANKPAKEYIYAGGKLLAVSEPANAGIDLAIWRPSTGTWWTIDANWNIASVPFGLSTDVPAPADYDGDGRTDFAVYRSSDTSWYILLSGSGDALAVYNFGASGDQPFPADYNGDGKAELALFRASNSSWYLYDTTQGFLGGWAWGTTGDVPVPGDYDGDGKFDFAVWRESNTTWYVLQSSDQAWGVVSWGSSGDKPVPGDYDGDLKIDHAVWRTDNTWYIRKSSTGTALTPITAWGYQSSDKAVQRDYDSDGKTDIGVWRASDSNWYIIRSSNGSQFVYPWGAVGDIPVAASYRRY